MKDMKHIRKSMNFLASTNEHKKKLNLKNLQTHSKTHIKHEPCDEGRLLRTKTQLLSLLCTRRVLRVRVHAHASASHFLIVQLIPHHSWKKQSAGCMTDVVAHEVALSNDLHESSVPTVSLGANREREIDQRQSYCPAISTDRGNPSTAS